MEDRIRRRRTDKKSPSTDQVGALKHGCLEEEYVLFILFIVSGNLGMFIVFICAAKYARMLVFQSCSRRFWMKKNKKR